MKQRYHTYRSSAEANNKERTRFNLPNDYPHRPWSDVDIASILKYVIRYDNITWCDIRWLKDGCPTIYIESMSLYNMLLNCSLDIQYDELYIPMTGTTVAFALPTKSSIRPFCIGAIKNTFGIVIRLGFANQLYNSIDNENDFQKRITNQKYNIIEDDCSHVEFKELTACWRLFVATLLYMQAFPNQILSGPPKNISPILKRSSEAIRLLLPVAQNGISPHLRRFHFRTLRSSRFKRNSDGTVRVVPVRTAIIGDISKVKTIKEAS